MASIASKVGAIGPVEFYRAKLEYESSPFDLRGTMEKSPDKVCVVDVRSEETFEEGHIPGAKNIPLDRIIGELKSLPKNKTIVTYCADITCPASSKAALELAQKGFKVRHLVGGFAEWARKGYPVAIEK